MRPWPWPQAAPLALIVDDQDPNLRLLGRVLTDAGFDVMPASSGEQALSRIAAAVPDVILLDVSMPGMSGFEVLSRIRCAPAWVHVPVIFLTATHEPDLLRRAFDAGADDYVTKPFVANELLARVATHAELGRLRARIREIDDRPALT